MYIHFMVTLECRWHASKLMISILVMNSGILGIFNVPSNFRKTTKNQKLSIKIYFPKNFNYKKKYNIYPLLFIFMRFSQLESKLMRCKWMTTKTKSLTNWLFASDSAETSVIKNTKELI